MLVCSTRLQRKADSACRLCATCYTGLFESLAVLSYAITIATLAGLALPYIEENMVAKVRPYIRLSTCTALSQPS